MPNNHLSCTACDYSLLAAKRTSGGLRCTNCGAVNAIPHGLDNPRRLAAMGLQSKRLQDMYLTEPTQEDE